MKLQEVKNSQVAEWYTLMCCWSVPYWTNNS